MIIHFLIKKIRRAIAKIFLPDTQIRYAQFGEDAIIHHLFTQLGIDKPTYLDIGANEPKFISNTYFFYEKDCKGVLVEPNPYLYNKLKKERPNDIVINTGIGLSELSEADFYLFPNYANGLSTFSEQEAKHWQEVGMKGLGKIPLDKVIKMPLTPVNTVLEKYFPEKAPNFISIDVEGLDLDILKSLDFNKHHPDVFCVETLQYDANQKGFKNNAVIDFMLTKGYIVYADTWVNTIFCRKELI